MVQNPWRAFDRMTIYYASTKLNKKYIDLNSMHKSSTFSLFLSLSLSLTLLPLIGRIFSQFILLYYTKTVNENDQYETLSSQTFSEIRQ